MLNIFTEEIKNTRFILTLGAMGMLMMAGIGVFIMVYTGMEVRESAWGLMTVLVTAIIALLTQAFGTYFRDRKDADTAALETPK